MSILNTISLESNKKIKINFNGGNLSSDGGLLLIKEFAAKVGLIKLVKKLFKTNDHTNSRIHTDSDNLMQMLYQIIAAYFEDDCADELTNDPVLTSILEKEALASQPTLSRFWNRMDNDTLAQLDSINAKMRDIVYSIKTPEYMLFDLDSTLLNTYGKQEGEGFNFHYQAHGYNPLLCYDGITGDLLKAELRNGTQYCSNDADKFMIPLLQEYRAKYPSLPLYLRGDSGFASPDLYKVSTAFALALSVVSISANIYAQDTGIAFEENIIMPVYKSIQSIRRGIRISRGTDVINCVALGRKKIRN